MKQHTFQWFSLAPIYLLRTYNASAPLNIFRIDTALPVSQPFKDPTLKSRALALRSAENSSEKSAIRLTSHELIGSSPADLSPARYASTASSRSRLEYTVNLGVAAGGFAAGTTSGAAEGISSCGGGAMTVGRFVGGGGGGTSESRFFVGASVAAGGEGTAGGAVPGGGGGTGDLVATIPRVGTLVG